MESLIEKVQRAAKYILEGDPYRDVLEEFEIMQTIELCAEQAAKIERLRKLVELGYREGWTNAFNEIGRDPFRPEECDTWDDSLTRKALEDE